ALIEERLASDLLVLGELLGRRHVGRGIVRVVLLGRRVQILPERQLGRLARCVGQVVEQLVADDHARLEQRGLFGIVLRREILEDSNVDDIGKAGHHVLLILSGGYAAGAVWCAFLRRSYFSGSVLRSSTSSWSEYSSHFFSVAPPPEPDPPAPPPDPLPLTIIAAYLSLATSSSRSSSTVAADGLPAASRTRVKYLPSAPFSTLRRLAITSWKSSGTVLISCASEVAVLVTSRRSTSAVSSFCVDSSFALAASTFTCQLAS